MAITKEEKKVIKNSSTHFKNLNNILGIILNSEIRFVLVTILAEKDALSKKQLHEELEKEGYKIAYKNVALNLDKLHKEKLVKYEKKGQYNQTLVSLNKIMFELHIKQLRKLSDFVGDLSKEYKATAEKINA